MRNEYFSGGLKVPEPSTQADSLKIAWVRKYLDDDKCGKWKQVMKTKLNVAGDLTLFHCSISQLHPFHVLNFIFLKLLCKKTCIFP